MSDQRLRTKSYKNIKAVWEEKLEDNEEDSIQVKFYIDEEYKFSLPSNTHYVDSNFMFLIWYEVKNGPLSKQLVLLMNDVHSVISVYNAYTGTKLTSIYLFDTFLSEYEVFTGINTDYLYISGWFWSPIGQRFVYDMEHICHPDNNEKTIPGIQPDITVYCKDIHTNPGVSLFGCRDIDEFLEKHESISSKYHAKVNIDDMRTSLSTNHNILIYLLNNIPDCNPKTSLLSVLDDVRSGKYTHLYHSSRGNISGSKLDHGHIIQDSIPSESLPIELYTIIPKAMIGFHSSFNQLPIANGQISFHIDFYFTTLDTETSSNERNTILFRLNIEQQLITNDSVKRPDNVIAYMPSPDHLPVLTLTILGEGT